MRAWLVHEYGAPTDVLRFDDIERPQPGPGEVQIAVEAITINLNDIDGFFEGDTVRCRSSPLRPRDGGSRSRVWAAGRRRRR